MAELLDEASHLESTTVGVFRTAATVKGGRRFSFSSLVVVGDRSGRVGYGYGKSNEVPAAIEKAQKAAKRNMMDVKLEGRTIPHEVEGRFLASKVRLLPASPGTGVVAGSTVRSVLELAGISDCMTKCYGSTNTVNTVKAVFEGLKRLRTPAEVASLRGVEIGTTEIQERIAKGSRHMQVVPVGADDATSEGGESQ
jgi:small subunit ribosomal protein S5